MKVNLKEKYNEGFSLVELVISIAVITVLSVIAIPNFLCFPKKAKATAALTAMRQINDECIVKSSLEEPEIFSESSLNGYTIKTSNSNSCAGISGVISAVPEERNELPTFNLAVANNSLTYSFKGITGKNFPECLKMICGDGSALASLPPNESTLFGPDSGLSCREVKSSPLKFMYGNHYLGSGTDITLQPVTISIGDNSWEIKDVRTTVLGRPHYEGTAGVDLQWLDDFAEETVKIINESEGDFSAEIDTSSRGSIKIYSPSGSEVTDIAMYVEPAPYSNINSYAFPALGEYNPDKYRYRGRHPNEGWNEKTGQYEAKVGDKATTVCDGR